MNIVLDANVFRAFYEESVLNHPAPRPGRTASPCPIFARLGTGVFSYVDEGQQLEFEWRNVCKGGEEWFEGWLANAFASGQVTPIEVANGAVAGQKYKNIGFPFKGRDVWYIRVAVSVASACSSNDAYLVTEDIDFYDPSLKKDASREKHIAEGKGPVARQLSRDGVTVCCIRSCADNLA